MDDKQREDFINEVKGRNKKRMKPTNFNIKIVTSHDDDSDMAENLRKTLNKLGNVSYITTYTNYKSKHTGIDDYTVFIRDLDKLISDSSKKSLVLMALKYIYAMKIIVIKI